MIIAKGQGWGLEADHQSRVQGGSLGLELARDKYSQVWGLEADHLEEGRLAWS